MSDDTANHRPLDQDPDVDDDGATPPTPWDGKPAPRIPISSTSPF
ncbi:hypothetical protein [Streptomyces achromogenes]